MKALSIMQPWASLIAIGAKRVETRSWGTGYRGPLAIHASKGFPASAKRYCEANMIRHALGWPLHAELDELRFPKEFRKHVDSLPTGAVIAVCKLVECFPVQRLLRVGNSEIVSADWSLKMSDQERALGNYDAGRFGWVLSDVEALPVPIPARGALALWEWNQ